MADKRHGTLYAGVSADLSRRSREHREALYPGFTKRYGLKLLVWYEYHDRKRRSRARNRSNHGNVPGRLS
jgi:predicted GIY-YIG superfamily endonuclease